MAATAHGAQPVRGTQSFVRTLSLCWTNPGLTGLEVLWRWVYGMPAVWVVVVQLRRILLAATDGTLDPARLGLDRTLLNDPVGALTADPMGAAGKFAGAIGLVLPQILHLGAWLAPLLLATWVIVSSFGRTAVLRRVDPTLHARPITLMILQAIRITALAASFVIWFKALTWSSHTAITGPIAAGSEPNLVLYCALVIVLTIALFILWSLVSWWFGVAPLLAMLNDTGPLASLRAAGNLGALKSNLIEINLVMGIVKIALIVLAMVFSATPLPFQSVTTPEFLAWWWAAVTVVYLLGSDFFHVARLVSYLDLWRRS
ncbi:hypothetical protein [Granulicella tundricola]|uniref:Uncharacterized protein n=1 Tax=Granulicella tundricola (strain ATCC BAA-1859 / DSM 23138 / MP5ACTX9) TaxID=1198114 RepID=E8X1Z9_GRATM|nr:hypothetical protein [Granulicella tundricola]ADW69160.1 hypothetical protein AciX9_2116 [Granulicella tundricola MP5ACTX9]